MRITTGWVVSVVALLSCGAAWADGNGITADAERVPWASLHGRIGYVSVPGWSGDFSFEDGSGLKTSTASIMGDLYFGGWVGNEKLQSGGFRATSGIVVGARNNLWGAPAPASGLLSVSRRLFGQLAAPSAGALDAENATLPYIGVGYSSLATHSGWSFSADLGLVSLNPGNAVRLGRVFVGGQSLDDVVHDMRLAPVVQLGVSYSF